MQEISLSQYGPSPLNHEVDLRGGLVLTDAGWALVSDSLEVLTNAKARDGVLRE